MFHKSCVSVHNKQKLNQKRKHAESFNVRDASENCSWSYPIEVRVNRSDVDLRNFIAICFFRGEGDYQEKLHRCETNAVNQKVRKITHKLGDTTIMVE